MKKRYYVLPGFVLALILYLYFSGTLRHFSNSIKLKRYWQKHYSMVPPSAPGVDYSFHRVAKAQKDGCFFEVGSERNYYEPRGIDADLCEQEGGVSKSNQSYLWCSTRSSGKLFYGTVSNYLCQSYMNFQRNDSIHDRCLACEWEFSRFGLEHDLIGFYGDYRPPQICVYNPQTGENTDITPYNDTLLYTTLGIRAAFSSDGLVFLSGPGMGGRPGEIRGLRIFVFDGETNDYLGSAVLDSLLASHRLLPKNIRRCSRINGSVYLGLTAKDLTDDGREMGLVLKWTGDREDLFSFQIVGRIGEPVDEICAHNNRLYLHTWPSVKMNEKDMDSATIESVSSIYMSSEVPATGLSEAQADGWKKVWDYSMYEPDEYTWKSYIGGEMLSYNGYLYFGTLHMPFANFLLMELRNQEAPRWEMLNALLGTHRACAIFRCSDFAGEQPDVDLVFGMEKLPVYDAKTGKWSFRNNKLNKAPLSGPMGMWNPFNHYAWSMEELDGKLFFGTKSFFRMIPEMLSSMSDRMIQRLQKRIDTDRYSGCAIIDVNGLQVPADWVAGDVFYLTADSNVPVPVTTNGFGNPYNYGMRCMTGIGDRLYVGTANPYNLAPEGGYELVEVGR